MHERNVVKHAPPDARIRVRVDTGTQGPGRLIRVRVENSAGTTAGAVRAVLRGQVMVSPSLTRRLVERFVLSAPAAPAQRGRLAVLTSREREVLALVARGLANGEIADSLFVGETTVKTHLGRVLTRLGLRDRVQAVIFAYESGLVRVGD
ncbi:response regulator transcription factor [Streptomyces sp. NPDC001500]